jgi:hypothetical protein
VICGKWIVGFIAKLIEERQGISSVIMLKSNNRLRFYDNLFDSSNTANIEVFWLNGQAVVMLDLVYLLRGFDMTYFWLALSVASAMTMVSPGCSQRPSSGSSDWAVQVETSGGFSGRGNGNVLIDSEAQILYEKSAVPNSQMVPCKGTLSDDELREVGAAVAQTRPEQWQVDGLNVAAPDAFGYDLTLRRGNQTYRVKWYDNTHDKLPEDLRNLYAAISKLREKQAKRCDNR